MGLPNKGEVEGKIENLKGRAKESIGAATGDERLKSEGRVDQVKGQAREGLNRARRKIGEAIEDVGEDIQR